MGKLIQMIRDQQDPHSDDEYHYDRWRDNIKSFLSKQLNRKNSFWIISYLVKMLGIPKNTNWVEEINIIIKPWGFQIIFEDMPKEFQKTSILAGGKK